MSAVRMSSSVVPDPSGRAALLPVPQIRQAHDLFLDPADAEPAAQVVTPPYPGMQDGDTVTFRFASEFGDLTELEFQVGPADVGLPIIWQLDGSVVWNAYPLGADTSYEVNTAAGQRAQSAAQTLTILPPTSERLVPPRIDGQDTPELDPGQYPQGLPIQVPLYAGAAAGDVVLVYWTGTQAAASTVKWHAIETSDLARQTLLLTVEEKWLLANTGRNVTVMYQYAREGAAGSSQPLTLTILVPLVLEPPRVQDADSEGEDGNGESQGFLMAEKALSGVYIDVPEDEALADAVSIAMHWEGHPHGGQHVAEAPYDPARPLRFHIPKTAVAANIGGQSKRFRVFYRALMANGRSHTSRAFRLWIKPLKLDDYGAPQCRQAEGKPGLSLSDVPAEGAEVYVRAWPFALAGHALTLWITGEATGDTTLEHIARDAVPATQAELDARAVAGRVPRDILQRLKPNEQFSLQAKVSYDGGDTTIAFRSNSVLWLG